MFSRPVYLIINPSPLFRAHWALFIPVTPITTLTPAGDLICTIGKKIHATGSLLHGFELEFQRQYSPARDDGPSIKIIPLGEIESKYIKDGPQGGEFSMDAVAIDEVERAATEVEVPGKSLRSTAQGGGGQGRVEVRDCQTWLKEFVDLLVEKGILGESAREVVAGA